MNSFYRYLYTRDAIVNCRTQGNVRPCSTDGQKHIEHELLAHPPACNLADGAAQLGANLAKRTVDRAGQGVHCRYGTERDQSCYQSVFDQILTGLIIVQAAKGRQNVSFHSELSLKGWSLNFSGNPESGLRLVAER
jgi:hypothetical protein